MEFLAYLPVAIADETQPATQRDRTTTHRAPTGSHAKPTAQRPQENTILPSWLAL